MKQSLLLLSSLLILLLILSQPACAKSDGGFGIYLADSGEQVLSLEHIKAYHSLDYSFELNANGIEHWNSFQTSTSVPKLAQSLFNREFIIKINGNEVCRGQFYSLVSSATHDGIVILDSIMKLDSEHDSVKLDFGYPPSFASAPLAADAQRITAGLDSFFSGKHLLAADAGWWFGA